jgi:hypothetical protein
LAVAIYRNVNSNRPEWISKTRDEVFKEATSRLAREIRNWEAKGPEELFELKEICQSRPVDRTTDSLAVRQDQSRLSLKPVADEIESIRVKGLDVVAAYRTSWEAGRQIIERLYQETDEKITRFKTIAAAFREQTIDRTRKLFGNRGAELD